MLQVFQLKNISLPRILPATKRINHWKWNWTFLDSLTTLSGSIELDPAHYYVKKLRVALSIENWLSINLMSFFYMYGLLIIPALIIQR